ncbi:MAG TPA: aconitate hydratase AcnA [Desulforhopalus sp.]|nr:aconitate hydratase AcnA [Desulforhopalus sp.]
MDAKRFTREISVNGKEYTLYDIKGLEQEGLGRIDRLPFSIRILVENLLRRLDNRVVRQSDLASIVAWQKRYATPPEIPYHPARVLMQDFTGVPAVVDLAAMRDAMAALGGDPAKVNPLVPTELVIDHSVQVDHFGTVDAVGYNVDREYQRNGERYTFLKWAQKSFDDFKVVPPRSGICHQVNLEYLGRVVIATEQQGKLTAFPDTLVGLDSHTTMIDAIGVMGWGVGGIEAEAVMLGQPYFMSIPEVIGVRLTGSLAPGVTATDLVLTVTQVLRNYGVVEKFVEFFGPGMKALTVPERATIANMSPEYGATMGFFPVDEKTIAYLQMTNRREQATLVEAYTRANALFYTGTETPEYTDIVEIDLATVVPCVSGPARPQDRIPLTELKTRTARPPEIAEGKVLHQINLNGQPVLLGDDSVVIAAITSCTNTSNPSLMLGAGLLAKRAVERGVQVPGAVRTSFAPGSKVVVQYLNDAGLMPYLEALGFHLAGFGCTTCIGNSGPLAAEVEKAIIDHNLSVAAVLSGNRNFEARIHQRVKTNYLASPMLVVAFALAGRVDIDFATEPVGIDPNGSPVFLADLWPEDSDIATLVERHVKDQFFAVEYGRIFAGDENWHKLPEVTSVTYAWDANSTYIKRPPYFDDFQMEPQIPGDISSARALLVLGDMVTTDHISPAGAIPPHYPAGEYLQSLAVPVEAFNSYGSRRGNHEVMVRGSFGNIRLKNLLVGGKEGSFTRIFPEGRECFVHQAAEFYRATNTPLIVLAGLEYGAGSSRDWAAKGSKLLGVKAVIARSFERIHRSNLVGMGVLPLVFQEGEHAASLGLDGSESFSISGIAAITPRGRLQVEAKKADGRLITFTVISRLDTEVDIEYFRHGGILPYVLRRLYRG